MMCPRRLVPRLATFGLFTLLLVGSTTATAPRPPVLPQPAPGSYRAQITEVVDAEERMLAALQKEFDAARTETEARRIQRQIDLVKRGAELQLFELQLQEARRHSAVQASSTLESLVEELRRDLRARSLRYGLEVPRLQPVSMAPEAEGARP